MNQMEPVWSCITSHQKHEYILFGQCSLVVVSLLGPIQTGAVDWQLAPDAPPVDPSTPAQVCHLGAALSGQVGQPGDTFWLHGGDYHIGHVETRIHGTPGRVTTFRAMPGAKPRVDGSLSFFDSVGYVVFRDLELYSSDTNRISHQSGMGFRPTDIRLFAGVACYAPNLSFINLIVHDQVGQGFYLSEEASNVVV